jgi:bifunctional DNA-binding transcriptional regulator/antitoxin component of YhaV-PrlF toxin-antitoxin module
LAVAYARHQIEAEMLVDILRQHGIPALFRRTLGADVPEFQVGGARVILVPAERAVEARTLLESIEADARDEGRPESDPGS